MAGGARQRKLLVHSMKTQPLKKFGSTFVTAKGLVPGPLRMPNVQVPLGQQLEMTKKSMLRCFWNGWMDTRVTQILCPKTVACPKPVVLQKKIHNSSLKISTVARSIPGRISCACFVIIFLDGRMSKFHSLRCGQLGVVVLWAVAGLSPDVARLFVHRCTEPFRWNRLIPA